MLAKEISFLGIKLELENEEPPDNVVEFLDGARQESVLVFDAKFSKPQKINP